jgi:Spy/CpxP family protein refolding chaperone
MKSPMASKTRTIGAAAILLCGCAALGCGGSAGASRPAADATQTANDDVTAGLMEHHRYHHHGGLTLLIAMSLDTLGVPAEERATVETIRAELYARMEPARAAEQGLEATLADGLAEGHIDAAKVDASIAQLTAAAAAVHDAACDALNRLHDVLTPPQRTALVDKVESHWAVWQTVNAEETGASGADDGGHLAALAMDLGLTSEQIGRIRAGLAEAMKNVPRVDSHEVAAHLRAFGEAFRRDKFDARALATASRVDAHLVGWGATHLARFVEVASPVLTRDQRTEWSETLREHASHNPSAQGSQ